MPPQLQDQLKKLGAQVNAMSLGQKVLAVIGIGVLLLGGSAFYSYASKPDLVPVSSGVSDADAADITTVLQGAGIQSEYSGGSVNVPAEQASNAKMTIAAAGLPKQKGGFALLDEQGITATQFQQKVTYQRAVEGDLATTIEQLDGVRSAVVHLAVPEETVFTETEEPTKASVLIDTGVAKATDDQVNSIIQLVSSSVPNLDPTQVTVSDAKGELLSAAGQGAVGQGDEQTAAFETKTQSTIQAMLDKTLGPGKAIASVNATLNFDRTNRVSTTHTPSGALPSSISTKEEVYGGGNGNVGGALGTNGVLGVDGTSTTAGAGAAGSGGYSKKENTQDNANNTVVDNTVVAPGAVERMSVAVMVDPTALAGIGQQNLQQTVAAAAGFDEARGDQVVITPATFDTTAADAAAKELATAAAEQKSEEQWALIKQGAIALGLLLLVIVLLVAARKALKKGRRESVDLGELERVFPTVPTPAAPTLASIAPAPDAHLLVAPEPEPEALRRQEFGQLVDTQPAEVANLLRGWLAASKKG